MMQMQTIMVGQVQPSVLSTVETIVKNCKELSQEAAELRIAVSRWVAAHKEQLACWVLIPMAMAFWCGVVIMAAVLQGGAA